ncbi:mediator of RNA polymerase II transcription subunit 23 isoform X2 [Cryptomeria japonica]|uniref:mediator of RNA polymerase II transcription subunit 23 isoform X2 n=1 Tax=Cryptomeria japonica TaxID=3369 RepID=UPI0027D9ED88|nr:mediator of RNA polymerase II transcription subunit 23 isoform X2 [Cryptomeria japonica]
MEGRRPSSFQAMRMAVQDLFNLYLGRSSNVKSEDSAKETTLQLRKRITAINRDLPPRNEQFLLDFQQLQAQFLDQEQFRSATESVLFALIVQCNSHTLQADFLLFALQMLSSINFINWDSFLPSLLSAVSAAETSPSQSGQMNAGTPSVSSGAAGNTIPNSTLPNSSMTQSSNPASPLTSLNIIGTPPHGLVDAATSIYQSPVKGSDPSYTGQQILSRGVGLSKCSVMGSLRQIVCKVILAGLEHNLKPIAHSDIFSHMLSWLLNWNPRQQNMSDEHDNMNIRKFERSSCNWLHSSLSVVWALVDEDRCRIPFYELLHSGIQFVDNIPDDEALFALILEIHRRRDKIAIHTQMLDQHLHCPSFATLRIAAQIYPSIPGEPLPTIRSAPLTYPSVLGEPLHGEDVALTIQRGSLDWERALRCLRHALHTMPSPDWWKRVLCVAPCYRQHIQQQVSGLGIVFSSEMICEATIDRIMELMQPLSTTISSTSNISSAEANRWQEWLSFADLFFLLMRSGNIDFLDFVDKLASRYSSVEQQIVRTNHVTWLLAQVFRIEIVTSALGTDPKKMETIRKILSFHKERLSDQSANGSPQSTLLEFISSSQTLRVWSMNPSTREFLNPEELQKGKQIDEWWKQMTKGEHAMDYLKLDDKSMGMFWVLSHTMTQPACDAIMNWLNSNGITELPMQGSIGQPSERYVLMHETCPLPMSLLSGVSLHLCVRLTAQIEETMFAGQVVPSIAMVETYVRLLLVAPHSLFRPHFNQVLQRYNTGLSKTGPLLILLEMLNCRLIPLYRYHGKVKPLFYDVVKIIVTFKGKRGEHRLFRLAENLCINLILSLRDIILLKKDFKGPTELTETLNRIMVINLAITIKTRGVAEFEQMVFLQPLLEQLLGTSQHIWSEKTIRHFPPPIRDALIGRVDKRAQSIQAWQQAEGTVINQCTQLLSPAADPTYVVTYLNHSFPQHRQYLCAGAWIIMDGHPEHINTANLGRVLKELSPEEVTSNIYTMVDVLLHNIQLQVQRGYNLQEFLLKSSASLAFFMWTHELLPVDIVLLALIDRDDDPHALRIVVGLLLDRKEFQQRVNHYFKLRGPPEHWANPGPFQRNEPQQLLGNHLAGKDRYPVFFDDMVMRALPVIPLITYRLIENDATDTAEKVLAAYSELMVYHPFRFTFVREILAYFYGLIPSKLVVRILRILDLPKIPFSEAFLQHIGSNSGLCPPPDYFSNLLLGLLNKVIPPIRSSASMGDSFGTFSRTVGNRVQAAAQSVASNVPESQKVFYQNQDPGTYTQLLLETAVIEILSLRMPYNQIVSTLVQIVVHVQPTQAQSSHSMQSMSSGISQSSILPASPSAATADSMSTSRSAASVPGLNATSIASGSNNAVQASSYLMIQACGLLLAQLPPTFHIQFYTEAARIIKDCWWLTDVTKSSMELDTAFGYALWDPTWAFQDNTSTTIGNLVALVHAFFSNLPHEWLEGTHTFIKNLRPITTIAQLRLAFRIMGPLLPRLVIARPLFKKTLALLFSVLADVFGRNSQTSIPVEPTEISDLIDFLHHAVMYEAQGGAQNGIGKPKPETLSLCSKAVELLRPELQHLLRHLTTDINSSIYASTHPKIVQRPPSPLAGAVVI